MSSVRSSGKLTKAIRFGPSPSRCSRFPKGFLASAVHCGIKRRTDPLDRSQLDLGIVISTFKDTVGAGCFTKNVFKAAPVIYSMQNLLRNQGRGLRGLVVNSGCANAVTGSKGHKDAIRMGNTLDRLMGNENSLSSLVLSTGVIGQHLPIDDVVAGIESSYEKLSDSYESWRATAQAFMTTDTFPKMITHEFELGGREIRLVGIDKGAGMIHPSMGPPHATLLAFIATDVAIQPESLQIALSGAVERSFNRISVDGDMSTNDTVLCLANGAAKNQPISHIDHPLEFSIFSAELDRFALQLSHLIVRDGEGATKFVEVEVIGADSESDAKEVSQTVARSALVKCALNGEDANWGRILCAVGYSKAKSIDPAKVSVSFVSPQGDNLKLLVDGEPEAVDEEQASEFLKEEDLKILINLGSKKGHRASYFTCDFSKEYVSINGDYRS
ncbi:arginine biosynthesis protein ArgJ [Phakopsora pachyrhizi]|uniref:Arginine biosynthesis bifunctional protein ArgJ, mitochondrial n=1 Tax=Phakopsora pachyrhizi TaxID=170000 RepID=A0AAV0AR25_PHAPC|nr:arginine biosynthesis protein ArgJ [Phakopsora pachyrhizi]CAH7671690.1 arginine biosynthesis protein ArgJ [Phakopsora pachyrhizi]